MMTYREIALEFNCTSENIRKIERRALRKLAANPEALNVFLQYSDITTKMSIWDSIEQMAWEK